MIDESIWNIVKLEENHESRFDILTGISLATSNELIFAACERARSFLGDKEESKKGRGVHLDTLPEWSEIQGMYTEGVPESHGDTNKDEKETNKEIS